MKHILPGTFKTKESLPTIYPPILVVGYARGGTSIIASILRSHGVWAGLCFDQVTQGCPSGVIENAQIRNCFIKPYLESIGADPLGQACLPDSDDLIPPSPSLFNVIRRILEYQNYTGGLWFYKDAKISLMWQLWVEAFPDAMWIIVRRKKEDVIASCERTNFMQLQGVTDWNGWFDHYQMKLDEIKSSQKYVFDVWPQKIIDGDYSEISSIIGKLGLEWNEEIPKELIKKEYFRKAA